MGYTFDWSVIWSYRELLLEGLGNTVFIFIVATVLSLCLGTMVGVLGASHKILIRSLANAFVEVNRNTPVLVKLFFIYFGFPRLGIPIGEYQAIILCLTLHQGAYKAEVVRAGIQSLHKGQTEAAQSLGLSRWYALRFVILPQAFVVVLSPLTTIVIETLKNTSIAMTISIADLTYASQQIQLTTFRGFESATVVTLVYCALAGITVLVVRGLAHSLRTVQFRIAATPLSGPTSFEVA